MIWDTFLFFNELDLLDLRLNVHGPFVDRFVLVESTRTFRGELKPLFYAENRASFKEFNDRITHVIVGDQTWKDRDPWVNEADQRNAVRLGLIAAKDDDTIHLSDVDEIVDFSGFGIGSKEHLGIGLDNFMYHLNLRERGTMYSSDIFNYGRMTEGEHKVNLNWLRHNDKTRRILNVHGWHFTYMGGPDRVQKKLQSFSHSEFDKPQYTNMKDIEDRIKMRMNVTGTCGPLWLDKIPITEATHPKFLVENQERYKHLILQ